MAWKGGKSKKQEQQRWVILVKQARVEEAELLNSHIAWLETCDS